MAGRVQSIKTSIDDLTISAAQDMTGRMNFVPADTCYEDSIIPIGNVFITNLYLRDQTAAGSLPIRTLAASLGRRLHIRDAGIWATTEKLAALTRPRAQYSERYADLLSLALIEELTLLGTHRAEVGTAKVAKGGLAPWQIRNLRDYVEANLVNNITISDLAVLVNLSESHFCRAFRKSFGVPPHRFLLLRRIERAKLLLKEPDKSIGDIGASCGFQFPYSLTAAFRRVTGVTPSEYRQSVN
jgi:AraC family transcriptional regulator